MAETIQAVNCERLLVPRYISEKMCGNGVYFCEITCSFYNDI